MSSLFEDQLIEIIEEKFDDNTKQKILDCLKDSIVPKSTIEFWIFNFKVSIEIK